MASQWPLKVVQIHMMHPVVKSVVALLRLVMLVQSYLNHTVFIEYFQDTIQKENKNTPSK